MQQIKAIRRIGSVLGLILCAVVSFAQEKSEEIDVTINKDDSHIWYTSPWVWIVGSIVFILLLLAVLRGTEKRG
ncbi:hypothetical protein [Flavisolibacter tropicus]|uniref:Uncharacterized protein n=1 Tax=Flavisolibacter tropicus TaxID=1492898 RepID=A0A172TVC8_9BACT|nr:hypothetical protein [Flavisolibacter tropicus]ANE51035.1 hypothetical protein SY85_11510 [Flavisolibacter tropicus]